MAGTSHGAPAPLSTTAARRPLQFIPGSTRTRRNHGAFLIGRVQADGVDAPPHHTPPRDGRAAAICCFCGRHSNPVPVDSHGELDLWFLPTGWSPAPSSVGAGYVCPECNERRSRGATLQRRGGQQLALVYSSRRAADGLDVIFTVGSGSLVLTGCMTPTQARAIAQALGAAADAADMRHGASTPASGGHVNMLGAPAATSAAAPASPPGEAAPRALPGLWREESSPVDLVWLDTPAITPGMVVVAAAGTDWYRRPNLRWQTWPDLLSPSTGAAGGAQ